MTSRSKAITFSVAAALCVPVIGLLLVPVVFLAVLGGSAAAACAPAAAAYDGPSVAGLSPTQMQRAAAVVSAGRQMAVPEQGIVVALATAHQESRFLVYANDGQGDDLAADQQGIEESLRLPHDAVGTDHGSLGVFQQQWPWWGTMAELMDPHHAARKFYEALLKIPGWQSLPVTVAAQRVQRSAFPAAYADDEPLARALLASIGDAPEGATETGDQGLDVELINGVYVGGFTDCVVSAGSPVAAGDVVFPLPSDSGFINQNNFGRSGSRWSSTHTGNDYSVSCGTAVYAATDGTIEVDSAQASWAGPNFVRVSTGSGSLATWYAHMQTKSVTPGQTVTAGQQIGTVGSLGNSSGCHLHFEVHPTGGGIYDDPVDPVSWLADHLGKDLAATSPVSSTEADDQTRKAITFNVLGADKTGPGSDKPGWPTAATRTAGLIDYLERADADLVAFQELQAPQRSQLNKRLGEAWGKVHTSARSLYWRRSSFKMISHRTFTIPHYGGQPRAQLVVILEDKSTKKRFSVINVHNPADNCSTCGGDNTARRHRAVQVEREQVSTERAQGRPVLLLGDLNDRRHAFCALTSGNLMTAANGGSNTGTCTLPPNPGIDWIFGTGMSFTDHTSDRSTVRRKISDHPLVSANFQVGSTISAPPSGDGAATVLTYNIGAARDIAAVAQEISSSGAAVIALQDVDADAADPAAHVKSLARRLRMQFAYTYTGDGAGRRIDNAILTKYPVVDADRARLPSDRVLLSVSVDLGGETGYLDVHSTHLDSGPRGAAQAIKVASKIDSPDCSTVMLADLSAPPGSHTVATLTGSLVDAFASFGTAAGPTVPNASPSRREDYVLVDRRSTVIDALVLPAGTSNHRAVRATVQVDEEGACG